MRMPGTDGLGVLKALGAWERMPPVLVLASHGAVPDAVEAMKLGAADILEKPYRAKALLQAIGQALALHPRRKAGAVDPEAAAKVATLSRRQLEVLRFILDGQPNKAIARRLELSLRTVEVHRAQLLEKLGVRGLADAIRLAIAAGMLQS
jgi:FixJ family two-component response regulator